MNLADLEPNPFSQRPPPFPQKGTQNLSSASKDLHLYIPLPSVAGHLRGRTPAPVVALPGRQVMEEIDTFLDRPGPS